MQIVAAFHDLILEELDYQTEQLYHCNFSPFSDRLDQTFKSVDSGERLFSLILKS